MFLEKGYTNTSTKVMSEELGISTGNFNFHFTKKEDLLAVLVEELCDFQWKLMEEEAQEGVNSLLAYCLELTTMVSASEQALNWHPVDSDLRQTYIIHNGITIAATIVMLFLLS
ncbi:MAG: TetR/AcrR family transcriptional regulator, partial [Clostridia bacterium]|nr:TetR/AcrR family transcriptional regulator [Clostridia bacterium]